MWLVHFYTQDVDQLVVTELKSNNQLLLNGSHYSSILLNLNRTYFFDKDQPLILEDVELNEDKKDGNYIFKDNNNQKIQKPIIDTRLPNSVNLIEKFKNKSVFIKLKGDIEILKCTNVIPASNYNDYELELAYSMKKSNNEPLKLKLGGLIINPRRIYLPIQRKSIFRKSEKAIIKWLLEQQLRTSFYLKKPVNNVEIGYIKDFNIDIERLKKISEIDVENEGNFIKIVNIFGEEKVIPFKTLETLSFQYETAMIMRKSDTSFLSQLGYKIVHKFKPQKVFY